MMQVHHTELKSALGCMLYTNGPTYFSRAPPFQCVWLRACTYMYIIIIVSYFTLIIIIYFASDIILGHTWALIIIFWVACYTTWKINANNYLISFSGWIFMAYITELSYWVRLRIKKTVILDLCLCIKEMEHLSAVHQDSPTHPLYSPS